MTTCCVQGAGSTSSAMSPLLDTLASASYLKKTFGVPCEAKTLAKLRCVGGGPVFRRFGRLIRYERDALDAWAVCRLSPPLRNTSEAGNLSVNQ